MTERTPAQPKTEDKRAENLSNIVINGVLEHYIDHESESWVIWDKNYIQMLPPQLWRSNNYDVVDALNPERKGKTAGNAEFLENGLWLPFPDPIMADPDFE